MRADRLLSVLLLLQVHGRLPAPEIARQLEVSVRTVYRDMDALSAAGFPVFAERGRNGGCVLLPGFRTDVTGLTTDEAQALLVLTGGAALADLGLGESARSAVRKLVAGLPAAIRPDADRLASRVVVDPHGWGRSAIDEPWLEPLRRAVTSGRRVRLSYAGRKGPSTRTLDPWGLIAKAGVWYLLAASGGEPRTFRVSRVVEVVVLAEAADRPDGLDLDAEWTRWRTAFERGITAPSEVVARVRTEALAKVEALCSAQLTGPPARDDAAGEEAGWERLTLTFRVAGATRMLLTFGADVEVLAPAEVRDDLRRTAATVTALYDGA